MMPIKSSSVFIVTSKTGLSICQSVDLLAYVEQSTHAILLNRVERMGNLSRRLLKRAEDGGVVTVNLAGTYLLSTR